MKSTNFEYDGLLLSDKGFMICTFSSDGISTVSGGSNITFNTISKQHGVINELVSTDYQDVLTTTFHICKNPCGGRIQQDQFITLEEYRDLMRWLNRKEYLEFRFLDDEWYYVFFEGTFNINQIIYMDNIVGLELTLITNRPFAIGQERKIIINNVLENGTYIIKDDSDEIGYIYPKMKITCNSSGNLSINNSIENRTTYIKSCSYGEVLTFDYPVISSSLTHANLQNDFNWNFFRLANTFDNNKNELTISIPCDIEITYRPIIKVGL